MLRDARQTPKQLKTLIRRTRASFAKNFAHFG
jgi:hypothetical protein